jgi:CTP-dependent riboflavin kinase
MLPMPVIRGKVVSGSGQAAFFTQLDWVRAQCLQKLGFEPFPGTLNVDVFSENLAETNQLQNQKAIELIPTDPNFCRARVIAVSVNGIDAALIIPEKNVRIHGSHTLEVLAPVMLKSALGIDDGDTVEITIKPAIRA